MTMSVVLSTVLVSEADLRAVYRQPNKNTVAKDIGRIDKHCAHFISLSPFLCIGTVGPNGVADVSPRGGEAGFVHVIDEQTLAMPDRPGNNRLDTLINIVGQPGVGLAFFIPGFEDVLRVNGLARITTDETLMARFVTEAKPPLSVIVIEVKEAYLHCPKAVRRAGLWTQEAQVDRASFPTAGQIYRDQLALEVDVGAIDASLEKDARERLY
jgi:PPOX class probable FMN-dependent enzyme